MTITGTWLRDRKRASELKTQRKFMTTSYTKYRMKKDSRHDEGKDIKKGTERKEKIKDKIVRQIQEEEERFETL